MMDPDQAPLKIARMKTQLVKVTPIRHHRKIDPFILAFIIRPAGGDGQLPVDPVPPFEDHRL